MRANRSRPEPALPYISIIRCSAGPGYYARPEVSHSRVYRMYEHLAPVQCFPALVLLIRVSTRKIPRALNGDVYCREPFAARPRVPFERRHKRRVRLSAVMPRAAGL